MIRLDRKFLYALFTLGVSLIWGLRLFIEWGSDFGSYYAHSYFFDESFILYNDAFSHKGPLYYLFISILGKIIGWGPWQAYLTLVITLLFFYIPIIFILYRRVSDLTGLVIMVISLVLLDNQDTNSSISLFQGGFLFLSFFYLLQSIATIENIRRDKYLISVSFFICAILVRIDALMYAPIFLIAIVMSSINRKSLKLFFERIIQGLAAFIVLYSLNQIYFGYSIFDFYIHNVEFNLLYNQGGNPSILDYIVRPLHFSLLMNSGVILLFLLVLILKHDDFIQKSNNRIFNMILNNNDAQQYLISLFIVLTGTVFWIMTGSEKNYHVFIIAIPLLFFVAFWGERLNKISNKLKLVSAPILLYMLMLTTGPGLMTVMKYRNCLTDTFCTDSPIYLYKKTVEKISQQESATIIGGRGWTYFFANTKPETAISDWWMYYRKETFVSQYLLDGHEKLMNQSSGYEFWIDNEMLNGDERSDYFYELINNAEFIIDEGRYSRYMIK